MDKRKHPPKVIQIVESDFDYNTFVQEEYAKEKKFHQEFKQKVTPPEAETKQQRKKPRLD